MRTKKSLKKKTAKSRVKKKTNFYDYQDDCPRGSTLEHRKKFGVGNIFSNRAKCRKCGQIIRSRNRHEFVTCKCGAISVDGGSWYLKRCGKPEDYIEMSILYDEL